MMMSVLEKACRACKLEHALPTLVTGEKSVALISFCKAIKDIVFRLLFIVAFKGFWPSNYFQKTIYIYIYFKYYF